MAGSGLAAWASSYAALGWRVFPAYGKIPAFRDQRLPLPPTPVANTGRGGLHIYVRPTGVDGTRRLFLDGVHIGELKSKGGLVLAPPSVTSDQYTWQHAPEAMTLHEDAVAGAQEGNRNAVLYWAALRVAEEGIPAHAAGRALARAAVAAGLHLDDGGPRAIDRILTSAFEAGA